MNNVMIDIETLSTSKNAVIISLGAVFFDITTGELGSSFYYTITRESCEKYGLVTDDDTIKWWSEQSEEAQAVLTDPYAEDLPQILRDFDGWLWENMDDARVVEIWGNGPSFDNAILDNAYRACGIKTPWRYSNERCVRTIVNLGRQLLNINPKETIERVGTHHHALADAEHQAKYVSAIYQALNAKPSSNEVLAKRVADLTAENSAKSKVIEHIAAAVDEEADPMACWESVDALKAQVEQMKSYIIALTHADETGYVDDIGFVENFSEIESEVKALVTEHDAEVKAQAVADAFTEIVGNFDFGVYGARLGLLDDLDAKFNEHINELRQSAKGGE